MSQARISAQIAEAAQKAVDAHGNFVNIHEVYGVLAEEVDEFFQEVKAKFHHPDAIRAELLDIAAVCAKAIEQIDHGTLGVGRL